MLIYYLRLASIRKIKMYNLGKIRSLFDSLSSFFDYAMDNPPWSYGFGSFGDSGADEDDALERLSHGLIRQRREITDEVGDNGSERVR